ncbi:MAG: hypothetical protein JNM21_10345 [Taibaiella sp.]|nr:hypothetical protein [Taibaiella sp.]
MTRRLDYLLRKNKGDKMFSVYRNVFLQSGFQEEDLKYVDLEKTDEVMKTLKSMAHRVQTEYESISGNSKNFEQSKLLYTICKNLGGEDCYIYTDHYEYCGMFLSKGEVALHNALNVAFKDDGHTCFVLNVNYKYSFLINYENMDNHDFPNEFDIQYRTWRKE